MLLSSVARARPALPSAVRTARASALTRAITPPASRETWGRALTSSSSPCRSTHSTLTARFTARQCYRNASTSTSGGQVVTAAKASPSKPGRVKRYLWNVLAFAGFAGLTTTGLVVAFFIYDWTTYRTEVTEADVYVPQAALNPRRGGPKNLPIADCLLDDGDGEEMLAQQRKPKLVILGSGWGNVAMLKTLEPGEYHVTLASPNNYFLFTPLLPSAASGTLALKSLVEPVKVILNRIRGHYVQAKAVDIDMDNKLVEMEQVGADGKVRNFYLPYDKLVIGVGCVSNPHGVKGLEHCSVLKSIDDARDVKSKILRNIETACLPGTTEEERRRLLSFVICGGGPTGVEFAAELYDMLNEDLPARFPKLLRNDISIHVVQSQSHILNTYDETLSKYVEEHFARDQINVLTNSLVEEVTKDKIYFSQKVGDEKVIKEIPQGFCLWSTGVAQNEFCKLVSDKIPEQHNVRALETDSHLRVCGAKDIYAIGDCSTVQNNIADSVMSFVRNLAFEKGKEDPESISLTFDEWVHLAKQVRRRFPQAEEHLRRLGELFKSFDKDESGTLDFAELSGLLHDIDKKLTSLPATAQRANQQGIYLGRKFNRFAHSGVAFNSIDDASIYPAFRYRYLGSLAYVGNAAIFDFPGRHMAGGLLAVYLWRSIYFAQTVSFRTRVLLAMDWANRAMFGRGELRRPTVAPHDTSQLTLMVWS
ncbi:hypothetical protein KEM52_005691 [Ascosphaera acerosa]|nr:hypothetical protein KEM52_005691 [Ascosphaera acerosa]